MTPEPEMDPWRYYPQPFEPRYQHRTGLPIGWGTLHANASPPTRRRIRRFLLAQALLPVVLIVVLIVAYLVVGALVGH